MQPKRASKRQETAKSSAPTTKGRRNGRKSIPHSNICLTELPYDVLFEIFAYLMPQELLHLCGLHPSFRLVLENSSSSTVWRSARSNAMSMPKPFPGMSEYEWAFLMFVKACNFCWDKTVVNPDIYLRTRICLKCSETHLIGLNDWKGSLSLNQRKLVDFKFTLIPTHQCEYMPKRILDNYALLTDYEKVEEELSELNSFLRAVSLIKRRQDVCAIRTHALNAHEWWWRWKVRRYRQIKDQKDERMAAIFERLDALGYEQDLEFMEEHTKISGFFDVPGVDQRRPLTDRIWANISAGVIKFMDDVCRQRLAHELKILMNERKPFATSTFLAFRKTLPGGQFYPSLPDIYDIPEVKEILSRPRDVDVNEESFQPAMELIPAFIETWRRTNSEMILKKIDPDIDAGSMSPSEINAIIQRVSSVLLCSRPPTCCPRRVNDTSRATMLYGDEVFAHKCSHATMHYRDDDDDDDDPALDKTVQVGQFWERIPWRVGHLRRNEFLREIVEMVVGMVGKDPNTAVDDMDEVEAMFECRRCVKDGSGRRSLFGWRGMVYHIFCAHRSQNLDKFREDICVVNPEDEDGWAILAGSESGPLFECFECRDTPKEKLDGWTREGVELHLQSEHGEEHPVLDVNFGWLFGSARKTRCTAVYLVKQGLDLLAAVVL